MLAELAEIGMELAREVRRQALGGPGSNADWGLVFARVARAVRQTVALEARLAADAQGAVARASRTGESRAGAGRAGAVRAGARAGRADQQKIRVKRLVEAAILDEADGRDAESLLLDLDERLEDPDMEAELGQRPIGVIVAAICEDLGITVDLSGFSDAELGFDTASMHPGTTADADADGLASPAPGRDRESAPGRDRESAPGRDREPDPGPAADTGGPPAPSCPSPWPRRLAFLPSR